MAMSRDIGRDEMGRESEAEYTLEYAARCPHCRQEIEIMNVARLLRTRVNFTSTLPRKGYVIICSSCRGVLSATLGSI